jgi:PleD family two-component response regulator
MPSRKYPLNFSLGYVTSNCDNAETLVDLVQQADAIMYEAKRNKKHAHAHADESMSLAV